MAFWLLALTLLTLGVWLGIRRRRRVAAVDSLNGGDFFRSTFDAAAVGMAIADVDGRYVKVNRAMCEFLGYSEAELLTMTYFDVTHPDDLDANVRARARMMAGEFGTFQMEKRYLRKDGRAVWAMMVVSCILDRKGQLVYSIGQMLDIDSRKRIEENLRSSQESLARAQRIARVVEWEWWIDDDVFLCSPQAADLFPRSPIRLPTTRREFMETLHPGCHMLVQCAISDTLQSGKPFSIDVRLAGSVAEQAYLCLRGEVLRDAAGKPVRIYGTAQDITERELNKQVLNESRRLLRELSSHQEMLLERERKRISREIHDELGQRLTALKMDVSLLRMRFGTDPQLLEKLEEMRHLTEGTIQVVRDIASDLRPAPLDLGLVPAIEWLARDIERRSDVCCRLDLGDGDLAMSDDLATVVFRVAQESLTNVLRHANASEVVIRLYCQDDLLTLVVKDDGHGFDAQDSSHANAFGLLGMRERVLALGGRLQVNSQSGRGCVVSLAIPLLNSFTS